MKNFEKKCYVDGGYRNNIISWAYVILINEEKIEEDFGIVTNFRKHRQVTGELNAVIECMNKCKEIFEEKSNILIVFDYLGIEKWVTGEWKTNNELTVFYKEFMKQMPFDIHFQHVRGHTGVYWNEYVDSLAAQAVKF